MSEKWKVDNDYYILNPLIQIAEGYTPNVAVQIVKEHNAYPRLVEALDKLVNHYIYHPETDAPKVWQEAKKLLEELK